jgi:hypothetical protein
MGRNGNYVVSLFNVIVTVSGLNLPQGVARFSNAIYS